MTPLEALDHAVAMSLVSSRKLKPGEVVSHLPPDVREVLTSLTSDDARRARLDWKLGLENRQ